MSRHRQFVRPTAVLAAVVLILGLAAIGASGAPGGGHASPHDGALPPQASDTAKDRIDSVFGIKDPADPVEALWAVPSSGWTATEEHQAGAYIWTDQVFDDHGAADYAYPSDGAPYMRNAADLVEVRATIDDAGNLVLGARLNTLLDPNVPVVAIGITDPAMAERAETWPGAGVRADGVRWVVTLDARDQGSTITDLTDGTITSIAAPVVNNNTDADHRALENTITASVTADELGSTIPSTLGLYAVAGAREPGVTEWYRPDGATTPPVYDVAFFIGETFDGWEHTQQAALIGSGDITAALGTADLTITHREPAPRTGAFSRIYRPSIEMKLGEGITSNTVPVVVPAGEQASVPEGTSYLGLFVPYAVWVPSDVNTLDTPLPMFVALHGLSQTHMGLVPEWTSGGIDVPAVTIFPLGHGDSSYYQGSGELDVLESMQDVERHYPIDVDRVFLTGLSMGGIGVYNVATHRPDLFAGAVPVVGPGSGMKDFLWPAPVDPVMGPARDYIGIYRMGSFGREVLDNALNVPFRIFAGLVDPLSTVTFQEGDVARWEELGYDYQHALFLQRSHEFVTPYINTLYHQLLSGCTSSDVPGCDPSLDSVGRVRDTNPARVVYKAVPFHWYSDLTDKLVFDGAYWVSDMQLRDQTLADAYGRIDVTSKALGSKLRGQTEKVGPEQRHFEPTGDDYLFQGRLWGASPIASGNAFDLNAQNLAGVTLDVGRMQLDTSSPIVMAATGDGATSITLAHGAWANGAVVRALVGGVEVARGNAKDGAVTLAVTLGDASEYVITAE
jgi:pimeloyl-ACP methyl ester carboxylesterase